MQRVREKRLQKKWSVSEFETEWHEKGPNKNAKLMSEINNSTIRTLTEVKFEISWIKFNRIHEHLHIELQLN